MKATYKTLIDNSLAAALASIEIYNKPDFKYRNETFVILIINAWELLLKAKILKDNNNKKSSLYVKRNDNRYKTSRTGNYLTIDIKAALEILKINNVAVENLEGLLEIRDTALHFYNKDTISYTIFALGAATLQNYQKLIKQWFLRDLSEYNFYILPLGFNYSFKNFQLIDINREPTAVRSLLSSIVSSQVSGKAEDKGFYLVADIQTTIVSAKKMAHSSDLTIKIDQKAKMPAIIKTQNIIDKYPFTATQVAIAIEEEVQDIGRNKIWEFIRKHNIKNNPKYSAYSFPHKQYETEFKQGKRKPPASVYNQDAVLYIKNNIKRYDTSK